jgi:hypothetical protein
METAPADGKDNRGNGVQFPAQAIDFSLFDMAMTGIRLFKNFNDIPSAMAYIWGSDAEVVMREVVLQVAGRVLVCFGTFRYVSQRYTCVFTLRVCINLLKSPPNRLLQASKPAVPRTEPQQSAASNSTT